MKTIEKEWKIEGLEEVTAPMDSDLYLTLEPLVMAVASSEWKSSHIYSIDDVAQAIWEHMMRDWKYYADADEALVKHMARRAARRYCQGQRTQYMYSTGAFLYTPGMVRRYLEDVVWCSPEDCRDVDARVDLSEAYRKLPRAQKAAVYKKYALKEPLTRSAEQVAESRAVSNITHRLNTGLRLQPEES
jgi:DNA-directed RNA polymerase specialized sigma24 family protein